MIPVLPQPEPPHFDVKVRQRGHRWLARNGIALAGPITSDSDVPAYWRDVLDDLHSAYDGICAYLCVFVSRVTGGATVDHFVAKSSLAGEAYEWTNYRFACSRMNARKRAFDDVLDPFELRAESFHLEFADLAIFSNPYLDLAQQEDARQTIERLGLDSPWARRERSELFEEYLAGHIDADFLRRRSPFVWYEANRQGLL